MWEIASAMKLPRNDAKTVDNSAISVDNPVYIVYKTSPNQWKNRGFHAPKLWIAC
jgi:hypothetical protein